LVLALISLVLTIVNTFSIIDHIKGKLDLLASHAL